MSFVELFCRLANGSKSLGLKARVFFASLWALAINAKSVDMRAHSLR